MYKKTLLTMFLAVFLLCVMEPALSQSTGSIQITLLPQEARDLGARWRRSGTETWFSSGYTETNVPTGSRLIEFIALPGWYKPLSRSVNVLANQTSVLSVTYSPYPVPGPNFAGCAPMGGVGTRPYAQLPSFDIMTLGGPVLSWPLGQYNFCAYLDTIYCSLPSVAYLDARIAEFANLMQCLGTDLNGPLTTEEIPFTPNGIPDGQAELGVVAAILNDPGHSLHAETTAVFQYNYFQAKELLIQALSAVPGFGDLRAILNNVAPYLPRALAAILAGYATLGDEVTLDMLDAMLETLEVLGMEAPEGGIRALMQSVPELGESGDANGDGFTNRQAYNWYVERLGNALDDYPPFAVDPNQSIQLLELQGGGVFLEGSDVELQAVLVVDAVSLPYGPQSFSWFRNGMALGETVDEILTIEDAQKADSGLYRVSVPVQPLFKSEDNTIVLSAEAMVQVLPPVPAVEFWGIAVLAALILLLGVNQAVCSKCKRSADS